VYYVQMSADYSLSSYMPLPNIMSLGVCLKKFHPVNVDVFAMLAYTVKWRYF